MVDEPQGSRYPPNIFNERDDDEDRELKIIFHMVFDPEDPLDLTVAAENIDTFVPHYTKKQYDEVRWRSENDVSPVGVNPENAVDWVYENFFFPLAKQIPFDHPFGQTRLLDLLLTLHSLPTPDWIYPFGTENIWKRSNMGGILHSAFDGAYPVRWPDENRNFSSWMALLHNQRVADCSLYALWHFKEALEILFGTGIASQLEVRVPLAAEWVIRAGPVLSTCDKDFGRVGRGYLLWEGKGCFCAERWQLWKSRFLNVSELEWLSQETRNVAAAAAKAIDWVE